VKGFSTGARGALNALDLARAKNRLGRHVIIRAERARKSLAFQWQRQCGAFVERHLGQRLAHAEPQSRDTPRCPASIVIHAESVNRGEPMKPTDRRIWPRHWVCLAPKIGFAPRQMVLRGTELVGSAEYSQVNSPKCRHPGPQREREGFRWDAVMVGYVRMVTSLIEQRWVSEAEIVEMLVRTVRQHSMARRRRMDYVLAYLKKNAP